MSNPRSTRSNIPENLSRKHGIEAISLVKEEFADPKGDDDKQTKISIELYFLYMLCNIHDRMFALMTIYY